MAEGSNGRERRAGFHLSSAVAVKGHFYVVCFAPNNAPSSSMIITDIMCGAKSAIMTNVPVRFQVLIFRSILVSRGERVSA